MAGSVLRRHKDPRSDGVASRLLDRLGMLSVTLASPYSLMGASFAVEVLALFSDDLGLDKVLEEHLEGRRPTWDMLSSGVSSASVTVGRLCLFEVDLLDRRPESGLYPSS